MSINEQLKADAMQLVLTAAQVAGAGQNPITVAIDAIEALANAGSGGATMSEFDADGVSAPDDQGCVRLRDMEIFRAEIQASSLPAHVKRDVLEAVGTQYACTPGLAKLPESDPRHYMVAVEVSHASLRNWLPGPEQVKVNRHFVMDPNAPLPRNRVGRIPNEYVEGGVALPKELATVEACVRDLKAMAARIIEDYRVAVPSDVDFSPAR